MRKYREKGILGKVNDLTSEVGENAWYNVGNPRVDDHYSSRECVGGVRKILEKHLKAEKFANKNYGKLYFKYYLVITCLLKWSFPQAL